MTPRAAKSTDSAAAILTDRTAEVAVAAEVAGISIDLGGVIGTNLHPLLLIRRIISFTRWFIGSRSQIVCISHSRRLLDLQVKQSGTPNEENCL